MFDLEGRVGIVFKLLTGEGFRKELFDTDKIVTINLKEEESIALMDRDDNLWELFKNKKGRYSLRKLRGKQHESEA